HKKAPDNGMADIACPDCGTRGQWTEPQEFSGLVKTFLGPVDSETGLHYLRPETAQGIFVNFNNVLTAARKKPPFGIGQIGKAFRNEITPATSSSAPVSSSRWRSSTSSAPTKPMTTTSSGSRTAGTGSSISASRPTTSAVSTCPPRNGPTTPRAPSTSTTASASTPRNGPHARACRT